jgi:hypothetical protein
MGKNRVPRGGEVIEAVPASIASERRMPQIAEKPVFAAFRVRGTNVDAFALRTFDADRLLSFGLTLFFLHQRWILSDATTPATLGRGSV